MISANARAPGLSQFAKAVSQNIGGQRVVATSFPSLKRDWDEREESLPATIPAFGSNISLHKINVGQKKVFNLNAQLFNNKSQSITGIGVNHQYRLAHTDLKIPSFKEYKRPSARDPKKNPRDSSDDRRAFTYLMTTGLVGVSGVVAAKATVRSLLGMLSAGKDALALSKIEVNIGNIPEGKNVTVKWQGKNVFIRHRTQKEIATERAVDIKELRDPETDEKRAPNPQWLIVIGICTHLGCVPIAGKGDFGGYYCPCHGSHYDASGRIRKGPAPLNLEVPKYQLDGDTLIIG